MTRDITVGDKHRFWMLDLLRGASAILVLVYHSSHMFPIAYAAVDLFFMLSGFVLAEKYGESLLQPGGRRDFIRHRIARLYPVYLAGTLLGAVSVFPLIGHLENWSVSAFAVSVVTSLVVLPAPSDTVLGILPLNGPAWSLFFEVVANIVFLFTAAGLEVAVSMVVLSAPALVVALWYFHYPPGSVWGDVVGGFPRVLASFYGGVLISCLWRRGLRIKLAAWPGLILVAALTVLYSGSIFNERKYYLLLTFVAHPVIIWFGLGLARNARFERIASWMGEISYPLYLTHIPLLIILATYGVGDCFALRNYLGLGNTSWGGECHRDAIPLVVFLLPVSLLAAHLIAISIQSPGRKLWLRWRPI
ncbi:acyltransferase [Rhizobium leguminosarum bv. trifolii]|uniref:Acyltransferase n=1 Tax=Rhizobium leguminosarum bv. trifolii TaxID=386 RepID=A0A3E1BGL9_RHILT|nr:acyltransferase [Rhizobium leguminosarum]RFB91590.1 acyltransferase [Rhizobium leguminosarum bv. trifolii]RFB92108.1 acyltransferase [Rhizobium leguminosarum bv. trifolii]